MRPDRWPDALLDAARQAGDPVADAVIDRVVAAHGFAQLNTLLNALGRDDQFPDFHGTPLADTVREYIDQTSPLPEWADPRLIAEAERLFFDHGVMVVIALFCGSLAELYALRAESAVLQRAGQLEAHTERRIRETARMIFPVMSSGGLGPSGTGVRQVQKVRLIHATIRHLILKGDPGQALPVGFARHLATTDWDAAYGVPINQEQLAYTLLTFSYSFVCSWRKLGVRLSDEEARAFLHCWNVAGHVLGIQRALMADTMEDAAALFTRINGRDAASTPNGRALAAALVAVQERHVPWRLLKPAGPLFSRFLIGRRTANLLGIATTVPVASRAAFAVILAVLRASEAVLRVVSSRWSPLRFVTRIFAHQYLHGLLMDQTRPLVVRDELIGHWAHDPGQPRWVSRLGARFAARPASRA